MYHFLEITCPNCKHQFVWLEHTYKGSSYEVFRRKGYDEVLESTLCPKCNTELVVLNDSLSGINIKDESIESIGIMRGI